MVKMLMKFLGVNINNYVASNEVSKSRYEICKKCEHFEKRFAICKMCGCFMKLKTRLLKTNCPINKWSNPYNSWSNNN